MIEGQGRSKRERWENETMYRMLPRIALLCAVFAAAYYLTHYIMEQPL